jgi:hypothetical protein
MALREKSPNHSEHIPHRRLPLSWPTPFATPDKCCRREAWVRTGRNCQVGTFCRLAAVLAGRRRAFPKRLVDPVLEALKPR